ncbi:hypothetical protein F5148DRAFT_1278259 [Russula earlei]|uniref:Uncharacterized protein n=1 Tax=Russula earlei TaxID=71964 RepID=A0ACC0TSS3_9AGAM|nr:hypothetical protein F5148DRAFT_1278259 [Russula earlei]
MVSLAIPCNKNGNTAFPGFQPPPLNPVDAMLSNPWHPFSNCLDFEFVDIHFSDLQSSIPKINQALDFWLATTMCTGGNIDNLPWCTADHMYQTINSIKAVSLCFCDLCLVLQDQLASSDLHGHFYYVPYMQFNEKKDHVWSNLMSGTWAWQEADDILHEMPNVQGVMLVLIIVGSDKTTMSIMSRLTTFCQQLYHTCLAHLFLLGPYIADYPQQVWLTSIVQCWCPVCKAPPENLDDPNANLCSQEKTQFLLKTFDPDTIWDNYGVSDIHKLGTPNILYQLVKGVVSAFPVFPGLQWFPDGHDFTQWTGDDSKALIKVYIPAITGLVPDNMVTCITDFVNCCYVVHWNTITAPDLQRFQQHITRFHDLQNIFIMTGAHKPVSLPCQHALLYYLSKIELFASPNSLLCSMLTESKHKPAVKETWQHSNHHNPLPQMMVRTIFWLDKLLALHGIFHNHCMLNGTISKYILTCTMILQLSLTNLAEGNYPTSVDVLAAPVNQPGFPTAVQQFIYAQSEASFYAPSDLCGSHGMYQEQIHANPTWRGNHWFDTVFVTGSDDEGSAMNAMLVACFFLFFLFHDPKLHKEFPCVLVNWFVPVSPEPDYVTGMWAVKLKILGGKPTIKVIHLDSIV